MVPLKKREREGHCSFAKLFRANQILIFPALALPTFFTIRNQTTLKTFAMAAKMIWNGFRKTIRAIILCCIHCDCRRPTTTKCAGEGNGRLETENSNKISAHYRLRMQPSVKYIFIFIASGFSLATVLWLLLVDARLLFSRFARHEKLV